ncbi:hypothetical protein GIB67_039680 [Kingdonia uniflora]|uniref:BZIP domain-containing protein n=1 Tax=Kingdonia uniflora TaxID=39325 RepID=A0A7J7MPQ6_9MAGN|nr:hypothetical protein GIB67_039680 [Kingdonia uniflora]
MVNNRKKRRMLLNRDSSRQSRMKKQKDLDELINQVVQFQRENNEIVQRADMTAARYINVESENNILRTQMMELSDRVSMDIPEIPNALLKPWQLSYPSQQPIICFVEYVPILNLNHLSNVYQESKDVVMGFSQFGISKINIGHRFFKCLEEEQRPQPQIPVRDRLGKGTGTHNPQPPRQATQPTHHYATQEHMDQRIKELIEAQVLGTTGDFTKLQGSLIAKELFDMEIPKGFHTLKISKYKAIDPKEHIQQYRDSLGLYSNLNHILYRLYATSLQEEPL